MSTKRSHPPTLITQVHRMVRDQRLFGRGERVLVACSGGPDSSALLHAMALLRRRIGHEVIAVGMDHGLRAEARDELRLVEALGSELGIEVGIVSLALSVGPNLQDRARRARHQALQDEADACGARVIALGHTADDRAETVLLRLLRGAGPRGLAVLPPRGPGVRGETPLVRPLISCRRADVEAHVMRHRLSVAQDPSNLDRRFMRVRVREELMPLLQDLSPNIVGHLCGLAEMMDIGQDPLAGLGRDQRRAIERAIHHGLRKGGGAIVALGHGRELAIEGRSDKKRPSRPKPTD